MGLAIFKNKKIYGSKYSNNPLKIINSSFNEKSQFSGWNQQASSTLPEGVSPTADVISLGETYTYNNLEQLESVAVNFGSFTKTYGYTYYPNGLKKTYTNPESITYTYYYNKNNQLMAVHIPGEGQISWGNFNWMMPQTLLLPGGQTISIKYDDFQQLKERVLKKADSTELAKAVYEYDLEQNIKKIEKGEGIFNYDYDNLYRLTNADSPEGHAANDETFGYDGVGNRVSHTQNGISETQSYNQKNQLQAIDSSDNTQDSAYTYNNSGHTKTHTKNGVTTEYVYNHEERLVAVKRGGATLAEYIYNAYGQRVKKTVGGVVTWYLYNDTGLAAEYSDTGFLTREYQFHSQKTWMTDPLFVRVATGAIYYYHNDHLGTPQQLLDADGNIMWAAQYSAFGEAHVYINKVENNLRFPGQYYDSETGLHHNYFRDYDSRLGRYFQSDPIGLLGGLNIYSYAKSKALKYIDPYGLLVNGTYCQDTGTLTLRDNDTGKIVYMMAESGGKPFGDPIPLGKYEILEQAQRKDFYRLDPVDKNPRDDVHEPTGRDHFRLHKPGRTIGCIAAENPDSWEEIKDLIEDTRTAEVNDEFRPYFWSPRNKIKKYGTITVTTCR